MSNDTTAPSQSAPLDVRAGFEKWMSDRGEAVNYAGDGMYEYHAVNLQADAFRAGVEFAALARAPLPAPSDVVGWQNRMAPDQIIEGKNPPDESDKWVALVYAARAPLPETAPDPVVEANRKLLLDRSRVGVAKYGVTLAAAGLPRDQLMQHALEEALDLANYLQTLLQSAAPAQADEARDAARYRILRDADFSDASLAETRGKAWAVCIDPRQQIPTMIACRSDELDRITDASIAASLAGKDKQ